MRNSICYNNEAGEDMYSTNALPLKQERFNEPMYDSRSALSRANRQKKSASLMSTKNLATFTKERPSLKVIGAPNLEATSNI